MDMTAMALMALLAFPTAWALSRGEQGPGPWLLALGWMALSAWSLVAGLLSLPLATLAWLLRRRRLDRRRFVQLVNRRGWTPSQAPAGWERAFAGELAGQPLQVLLGWARADPRLGFARDSWPSGWQGALRHRRGLFPPEALPIRVEPGLVVFSGAHRAEVLEARLRDLEASLAPDWDPARVGRRPRRNPLVVGLVGALVGLVAASQWLAWEKLRVFPAEPSLLWRSLPSLPRMRAVLPAPTEPSVALADRLAVGGRSGPITLYGGDGTAAEVLPESSGWAPLAFSGPDLVACGPQGTVRRWPDSELGSVPGARAVACSGDFVAVGGRGAEVVVLRRTGGVVARMTRPLATVTALVAQGERALCGTEDGSLYLFELATGRVLAEREGDGAAVRAVGFWQDGLLSVGETGCLTWSGQLEPGPPLVEGAAVAGASDGRRVCLGYADGSITVYPEGLRLVGHQAPISSLALRGDSLLSGADDQTAKLWDLR